MLTETADGPLIQLEGRLRSDWTHLRKSRAVSVATRQEIARMATGLDSEDTSIVVSGSLARDEFTTGSDIDWTLLIDGSADPKHHDLLRKRSAPEEICSGRDLLRKRSAPEDR
jgi:predicted nucleotidyltransferase